MWLFSLTFTTKTIVFSFLLQLSLRTILDRNPNQCFSLNVCFIPESHSDSKHEITMYSTNGNFNKMLFKRNFSHASTSFESFSNSNYFVAFVPFSDSMFFEVAHFESSQRGSCVLIYDGKRFTRDGKFTETTNWRCCYFRDKCRARAITREIDGVTRVRITYAQHTCVPKRVKTSKSYDR